MKQGVFKYFFILGFIILLIVTYIVFYSKNPDDNKVEDKVSKTTNLITNLRLGIAELDTLNPILTNNRNVKEISKLIFDSLVTVKNNYELEFVLATSIAKENDFTYIIYLRKGVKWQDGTDFSSQDVKFTIDTIKNNECSYSSNLSAIEELKIIDESTIKIILSQEVDFFEYYLTMPILCSNYYNNEDLFNTEKNNSPIGTGIFKFYSYENGLLKLVSNDNYWNLEKKTLLNQIEINIYDSIGNMYSAFKQRIY